MTLTPSIALFGGDSHNNQTWAQQGLHIPNPIGQVEFYTANTALHWTDRGVKLGLVGKYEVNRWTAIQLGGFVGWSDRRTDLTGSDAALRVTPGFNTENDGNSSIVAPTVWKTAFLANLETSLIVTQGPWWRWRVFAGLNYDDSVPGISSPSFTGSVGIPTSVTPAGIYFAHETSYYAGGGLLVRFSPDVGTAPLIWR
jgi:hypothetical protein